MTRKRSLTPYSFLLPALVLLGKIVNGADTDNALYHQPEGPGLEAIAEGFRHLGYRDDLELNRAEWLVYDAMYAGTSRTSGLGAPVDVGDIRIFPLSVGQATTACP